jgi:hypothetical protein
MRYAGVALAVLALKCSGAPGAQVGSFAQRLDHFDALNREQFQQRFYADTTHWAKGGPVFFVPGGEAAMESMPYREFGLRLAKRFSAGVFALEHRFYGTSIPYAGNYSRAFARTKDGLGKLSVEQAVGDAVHFLQQEVLKGDRSASKVIAFGGSYSGKLAAYTRYSAPHVVHGALASSAPLLLDGVGLGHVHELDYFRLVTDAADHTVAGCAAATRQAFQALLTAPLESIATEIPLCEGPQNRGESTRDELVQLARVQFANAAMSNYPPRTDTLMSRLCKSLAAGGPALGSWTGFFKNLFSQGGCLDIGANVAAMPGRNATVRCGDNSGCGTGWAGESWDYQASTQVVQPIATDGKSDMFPPMSFSVQWLQAHNDEHFGGAAVFPTGLAERYGLDRFQELPQLYSRVIFSNGKLDPWAVGGIFHAGNRSIVHDGAHHSDLSDPTDNDTPSVVSARQQEIELFEQFLSQPAAPPPEEIALLAQ